MPLVARIRSTLRSFALIAALTGVAVTPAFAGTLPFAVNGQKLPSLAPMLARVKPAVVNISSTSHRRVRANPFFSDPIMRQFFGLPAVPSRELVQQSLGSGVIVNAAKGYILTNNHVIAGADKIKVTLTNGHSYKATLVGTDPQTDIAVIQIHASGLVALPLADSAKLRVGDFVVAIGDPFGLGQSATSGIVSALRRQGLGQNSYENFIQTDASINPGNSGGALVDLAGRLVGINSMIYSPSGASAGLGFAIPSNLAKKVMDQLIAHGRVVRGHLGIDAQNLTPRIAQALGIHATHGALITNVVPDSPAEKAGLKPGDLVTSVNGNPVHDVQDLRNAQGLASLGSSLQLGVERGGRHLTIAAKLTAANNTATGASLDRRLSGATFVANPTQAGAARGVTVESVQPGSPAAENGLASGDVVVGVNDVATPSLYRLRRVFALHPRRLLLSVVREGHMLRLQVGR